MLKEEVVMNNLYAFFAFSLSPSLTHKHTHTQTKHKKMCECVRLSSWNQWKWTQFSDENLTIVNRGKKGKLTLKSTNQKFIKFESKNNNNNNNIIIITIQLLFSNACSLSAKVKYCFDLYWL